MTEIHSESFTQPIDMRKKLTAYDIALTALMVAIIEVCKIAFMELPNIELTSFWLILFSKHFGKRVYTVVPIFILIEGVIFGFGIWWIMYLYAWPILILVTRIFKKNDDSLTWAIISGVFGLLFGFMCSLPYLFMGGIQTAFSWWVAGIPWDLVHGAANFAVMMLLYKPLSKAIKGIEKNIPENML